MRYRKLTATGDYSFGQGQANFWVNTPEAVGQAILTRLLLGVGQWFLDLTVVTNYSLIVGKNTLTTYDAEIQRVILDTQGVTDLVSYQSNLSPKRQLSVRATVNTLYGVAEIDTTLPLGTTQ